MNLLQKILSGLDREPTPGEVMARVIRLEQLIEKMANNELEALLEKHLAPAPAAASEPQQQQQQPQQAS